MPRVQNFTPNTHLPQSGLRRCFEISGYEYDKVVIYSAESPHEYFMATIGQWLKPVLTPYQISIRRTNIGFTKGGASGDPWPSGIDESWSHFRIVPRLRERS